jgi:energy-coupling factor transport system ATP-binding protein
METVQRLNKEGITVILITHFMEEAVIADRVMVLADGRLAMSGTPAEVFMRGDELRALGLDTPPVVRLAQELRLAGVELAPSVLTVEELVSELCR